MTPCDADRWLRMLRAASSARRRLVCFPYAGAGATVFTSWGKGLRDDIELRAVQLPGRQERHREPLLTRISEMRDRVLEALDALPPLPLIFYGHSLGGLLAFEVARRLATRDDGQLSLIIGACRPPHHEPRPTSIRHLPSEDFIAALERRYGSPSELRDPQLRAVALPVLRADITAAETHAFEAEPALRLAMTVLVGLRDQSSPPMLAAGWRNLATGELQVHQVDAGHLFLDTHSEWVRNHVVH
jgi:surfactin synthase thioesterase subunit